MQQTICSVLSSVGNHVEAPVASWLQSDSCADAIIDLLFISPDDWRPALRCIIAGEAALDKDLKACMYYCMHVSLHAWEVLHESTDQFLDFADVTGVGAPGFAPSAQHAQAIIEGNAAYR